MKLKFLILLLLINSGSLSGKTKTGVLLWDESKSYSGYNIYDCNIMNMKGEILVQYPGFQCLFNKKNKTFLSSDNKFLTLYNINLDVIWRKPIDPHHELIPALEEDQFWTLSYDIHKYKGRDVRFDSVLKMDMKGNILWKFDTWENLKYIQKYEAGKFDSDDEYPMTNALGKNSFTEYFHINSVFPINNPKATARNKKFKTGHIIISFSKAQFVAVMDPATKKFEWVYYPFKGEDNDYFHAPILIENGNLLIFLNQNRSYKKNEITKKWSSVAEIDISNNKKVWEYTDNPKTNFYTELWANATELPNGNILFVDNTFSGGAREVTRSGETVWKFVNPTFNPLSGTQNNIYRIYRVSKNEIVDFLPK